MTLSDDNKDDPKSNTFKFTVIIKEKVEIRVPDAANESLDDQQEKNDEE